MFTNAKSKLDRAVILSVLAMLACNVLVLAQPLNAAAPVADASVAAAARAVQT